jgi:1-acyl-sn-glycerol-3-phosphate acyltransferase
VKPEPFLHRQLQVLANWLFTVYHDIQVEGAQYVPAQGAAIVAANHPTYLDPAFLMVGLSRPIRFMAWEKPFRMPVLGMLMRHYGAIAVDMKKPGRGSFEAAVKVLRSAEVFGIFPEGGRTKGMTPMNPLKSGVARLALITGAPIIPATIIGGRRVWRRGDLFPKPGPIRVIFHPPIRVESSERALWRRDKTREAALVHRLIETIHRTLVPSLRKEERIARLLKRSPGRVALAVEGIPFLFFVAMLWFLPHTGWDVFGRPPVYWIGGYAAYLSAEWIFALRGPFLKWFRQVLPWLVLGGIIHQSVDLTRQVFIPYPLAGCLSAALILWCTYGRRCWRRHTGCG